METSLSKGKFRRLFKNKVIAISAMPRGKARTLAMEVNQSAGKADATLHTKAEYRALFDLLERLIDEPSGDERLTLRDAQGHLTETGEMVEALLAATKDKDDFFDQAMYMVMIEHWPPEHLTPEDPVYATGESILSAWVTDPALPVHLPPPGDFGVLLSTRNFSLKNSGNRTLRAPKRSWKINFKANGDSEKILGMWRFNLKAMYNDPSQMREALAWQLFDEIGIPASRHSYAKLGLNDAYRGLFSLIEQVDKGFLKDHFGENDEGNLYKAYCGNVGCATLEALEPIDGKPDGYQYYLDPDHPDLTYRLKTNKSDVRSNDYSDLAQFINTLNGRDLPGGDEKFTTDQYRESMESILNVPAFLRWASANLLMGGWDNYFATPSNYYLYNSGKAGKPKDYMANPYFTWIPWDYDNSFGIDYFQTQWQYTDILDWPSNTWNYQGGYGTSHIPLVTNLLKHPAFVQYYLDHLEFLLDTVFNTEHFSKLMGQEGDGGLWDRVRQAAYLESDTPHGRPFTGRQFTNHQVYLHGLKQWEINGPDYKIEGIIHYVRMRYDSAREQLKTLRQRYPSGASGAQFSGILEPPPR